MHCTNCGNKAGSGNGIGIYPACGASSSFPRHFTIVAVQLASRCIAISSSIAGTCQPMSRLPTTASPSSSLHSLPCLPTEAYP